MNTKKKVLVVALAISMIAIAVGGTLAWFMDTDEVKNVFTVGSIDIEQIEVFDETKAQLIPVVGEDPTVTTDNYIEKNVTVKSIGENDAYVQTFIAVPKILDDKGIVKLYHGDKTGWGEPEEVAVDVEIDGETMKYDIYRIRHTAALTKGDVTDACLEYVYIDKAVDINTYDVDGNQVIEKAHLVASDGTEITELNTVTDKLNIYVATQGVQAKGFADADAALTSAFPNHPWAQ